MNTVIERILDAYGISYRRILTPQKGYRNSSYPVILPDQQRVNLILYKVEPNILNRIRRIHHITNVLSDLPVRKSIDPRISKLRSDSKVQYAALYNYLPGKTIPWEAYTKNHIKLVGMAMSTLHAELKKIPGNDHRVTDEYQRINYRMRRYFSSSGVSTALRAKRHLVVDVKLFDHFGHILRLAAHVPDQQLLHMDFVRGNLLFQPATATDTFVLGDIALSGIIDFEKTAHGHPVFDVARTLAFLLVDCKYKSSDKITKYFLASGYNKRGAASFSRIIMHDGTASYDLLYELTNMFLLYDFYKFLRHNPYEFLDQNEHFMRTTDILLERKVIESC